jgi:hypothetical protein
MKAEVKYFHSPEIEDLVNYQPEIQDNFCFLLQMMVGLKDVESEESFNITVCTPKWLLNNYGNNDIIFGRHYLIVFQYDFNRISEKLTSFVNSLDENNWSELAEKISRIGFWEFEDYTD